MVKITLRVPFHHNETAVSLVSRLTAANGISSMMEFCRLLGLTYSKIAMGETDEIGRLFQLAGVDPSLAERSQPRFMPKEKKFWIANNVVMQHRVLTKNVRFCPACIREDLARPLFGNPVLGTYARLEWLLSSYRVCPKHFQLIRTVPPSFMRHGIDLQASLTPHLDSLDAMIAVDKTQRATLEQDLSQRVQGIVDHNSIADKLGINGVMVMSELLGCLLEFGPRQKVERLDERSLARAASTGFELLNARASELRSVLIGLEPKGPRKPSVLKTLGSFYQGVHFYRGADIGPLTEVLREIVLERYPKRAGTVLFDKLVTGDQRLAYNYMSASKGAGVRADVLRKIAAETLQSGSEIRPGFISASGYEKLERITATLIPSRQIPSFLGLTFNQYQSVRAGGYISPARGLCRYFDRTELEIFVAGLAAGAQKAQSPPFHAVPLPDVPFVSVPRLILKIRTGVLKSIWHVRNQVGLRQIWLDPVEVGDKIRKSRK